MEEKQTFYNRSLQSISDKVEKHYDNFVLDTINDHCLRMSVFQEVYPWHYHKHTDELFIVLEGRLTIEIRDSDTIILEPGEFVKIPANTIHRTSATVRTVNLCFEKMLMIPLSLTNVFRPISRSGFFLKGCMMRLKKESNFKQQ